MKTVEIKREIRKIVFSNLVHEIEISYALILLLWAIMMIGGLCSPLKDFIERNHDWFFLVPFLIAWIILSLIKRLIAWHKSGHPETQKRVIGGKLEKAKMNYLVACNLFGIKHDMVKVEKCKKEVEKFSRYLNYCWLIKN